MGEHGDAFDVRQAIQNENLVIKSGAGPGTPPNYLVLGQGKTPQISSGIDLQGFTIQKIAIHHMQSQTSLRLGKSQLSHYGLDALENLFEQSLIEDSILNAGFATHPTIVEELTRIRLIADKKLGT
jgi:hypothetical protein|tara:strand:- start:2240 stop:2617 length:378 start_codon:yes stop_codon:yes gene_type:complete